MFKLQHPTEKNVGHYVAVILKEVSTSSGQVKNVTEKQNIYGKFFKSRWNILAASLVKLISDLNN